MLGGVLRAGDSSTRRASPSDGVPAGTPLAEGTWRVRPSRKLRAHAAEETTHHQGPHEPSHPTPPLVKPSSAPAPPSSVCQPSEHVRVDRQCLFRGPFPGEPAPRELAPSPQRASRSRGELQQPMDGLREPLRVIRPHRGAASPQTPAASRRRDDGGSAPAVSPPAEEDRPHSAREDEHGRAPHQPWQNTSSASDSPGDGCHVLRAQPSDATYAPRAEPILPCARATGRPARAGAHRIQHQVQQFFVTSSEPA